MGWFRFGGHDCREFELRIEHYPSIPTPERQTEAFPVPGRNGTLYYDKGNFANVTVSYECWFRAYDRQRIVPELGRKINAWLLGAGTEYQPLQDSYSPTFIRMARAPQGAGSIVNRFMLHGRCTIDFDCKPQMFLIDGLRAVQLESGATLTNRFPFPALPLIQVTGSGTGTLTVGSLQIELQSLTATQPITIDCERQNVYYAEASGQNQPVSIAGMEWPTLPEGETQISWSGGITAVSVIPRWWTV